MPDSDLVAFLKRLSLFADLNDAAITALARVCRVRAIPKGRAIFDQGQDADAAFIVRSGCVVVTLNTLDGRELVINEMRAGDLFGEVALLTQSTRTATATTSQASEIIIIPRDEFLAKIAADPNISPHIIQTLAQRLRSSAERESALAFQDAPARLAHTLLELDRQASAQGYVTISQEEISQRIGITRQTTAKILGKWRRAGWIITGRGKLVILDRAALRRCALETDKPYAGEHQ